ncbi:MAG: DNA polymerase II large subunit [Candidatus Nanohaloarchaeota archaeon QJJ-9]|nr:DNA polymerase II large subunit [Candidatus Nanohaloarchaeota archaeon QJJ-9]
MPDFESYFERIEEETDSAYKKAERARNQGRDPEKKVDIPVAKDLAAKAEGLITASMFPDLEGEGVKDRIRELEDKYNKNDERVALEIGKEIAENKFYSFDSKEEAVDAGLRVGLAYMTGGIVTAPLEGIAEVKIRENDDGSDYLAVYYAGPIRSAGGTASAMSVLLADYIRKEVGLEKYKPREEEIDRYAIEVEDYFTRVTKKQYTPERKEIKMIAENVPVEITGSPTESIEVSNKKDLERVDTNRIRGGMALVYLDGLPLKAPKIKKRIESYGENFGLEHWEWIEDYLDLQHEIHSSEEEEEEEEEDEKSYTPSSKFLGNLVAGRPVFSHPGGAGGFRLRYGRSRTSGIASTSFHPATMEVVNRFMAVGTQLKIEYPGKATVSTPCDSIEGPVVRLESGEVRKLDSREEVRGVEDEVEEIIFLGDILIPYGEFVENGKELLPSPYVVEWWVEDVKDSNDRNKVNLDGDLSEYIEEPFEAPGFEDAVEISNKLGVPLHPEHTFHWHDLEYDEFVKLYEAVDECDEGQTFLDDKAKKALEQLVVPHEVEDEGVVLTDERMKLLRRYLMTDKTSVRDFEKDIPGKIADNLGVEIRDQSPIYLGARMGRPEKAESRSLKGSPQLLFPCGKKEGGRMRNLMRSYNEYGKVNEEVIQNYCDGCNRIVPFSYCPYCGKEAEEMRVCGSCGKKTKSDTCPSCNSRTKQYKRTDIPLKELMNIAKRNLDMNTFPELLKSPRAVTGKLRHVEPIEKGLLRKKYNLYVNKDGTVRYDSTDLSLTHFKPKEVGTSIEKLRELGYTEDIHGEELRNDDQVLLLKPQDLVISRNPHGESGAEYMYHVANFVDELLEKFYDLDAFYELDSIDDIVGELVIGLAPHTSGGIVGRIIGVTDAKGTYAHPYWHTAKRRNCDGDEDSLILLMDGLLNFSRQFLPDQRGSRTMDAPLILSTRLKPDEVDDESWNVDVQSCYPRSFYEATYDFASPGEVDVDIAEDLINEGSPFEFDYTHTTSDIDDVTVQSNYVTLGQMDEKVDSQLGLGEKIRAVDEDDVAELLLSKHFISDIKGNLRAFSRQKMRCTNCNAKYRRVPLGGRCKECGGKLLLTVSEGAIRKYLEYSEDIADNFAISTYRRQQIYQLKSQIQSLFGKAHRQSSLGSFASS